MELRTKSGKALYPIGIGTWDMGSVYNPAIRLADPVYGTEAKEIEAIRYSILKGQNHIDTAELYGAGHTDEIVGQTIAPLQRQDLFVADKLWKTHVAKGTVRPAVLQMLKWLQTDYLDLLYIHAPFNDAPWLEAVPQIDELIDEGLVLNLGVSNFDISEMKQAMAVAKHPIIANQLHFNILYKQEATKTVRAFCTENHIKIVAYQPVERKHVLDNKLVEQLAKNHQATPAQVALAWLLGHDTYPIPKSSTKSHIDENLGAMELKLTVDELDK